MKPGSLTRFAWLSIAAALLTMALKAYAYRPPRQNSCRL